MEVSEHIIERHMKLVADLIEKENKYRDGILEINKGIADIQKNYKHKEYNVDIACRNIQDNIILRIL